MSALRAVGSGLGCALFAGLGALVGSEIGEQKSGGSLDSVVGGAMVGSAIGALLIGALAGSGDREKHSSGVLSGAGRTNPRFP
jgi:hypothetical protein